MSGLLMIIIVGFPLILTKVRSETNQYVPLYNDVHLGYTSLQARRIKSICNRTRMKGKRKSVYCRGISSENEINLFLENPIFVEVVALCQNRKNQ
jgi:hypothetical protein